MLASGKRSPNTSVHSGKIQHSEALTEQCFTYIEKRQNKMSPKRGTDPPQPGGSLLAASGLAEPSYAAVEGQFPPMGTHTAVSWPGTI